MLIHVFSTSGTSHIAAEQCNDDLNQHLFTNCPLSDGYLFLLYLPCPILKHELQCMRKTSDNLRSFKLTYSNITFNTILYSCNLCSNIPVFKDEAQRGNVSILSFTAFPVFSLHWWATWNLFLTLFLFLHVCAELRKVFSSGVRSDSLCDLWSFSIVRNTEGGPGHCRLALSQMKKHCIINVLVITVTILSSIRLLYQDWIP